MSVVTRFAPSPTGRLHAGNARTALYNWLLARGAGGRFILRSEDTDAARSGADHLDGIREDLAWLGLDWDAGPDIGGEGGPFRQSERADIYREYMGRLAEAGRAFACWRTDEELAVRRKAQLRAGKPPRYDREWAALDADEIARRRASGQRPVIRFRAHDDGDVRWSDLVRGERHLPASEIGDFILARADGSAAFLFANAVDDALMGVTHVLRGEDHLVNTARQLALLDALELPVPRYGHLPLLAGHAGERLSKRDGSLGLADWREKGLLPAAVTNYLARLGLPWSDAELLDLSRMAEAFDPHQLSTARPRLDAQQLDRWQRLALDALDEVAFMRWADGALADVPSELCSIFADAVRHNVHYPADVAQWAAIVFGGAETVAACPDDAPAEVFDAMVRAWDRHGADLKALAADVREATGAKGRAFFRPLRIALTGLESGPELGPLLSLMPADTVRRRLARCSNA